MNKRLIGGAGFVLIFFISTFTILYPLFYLFIAIVAIYEIYKITKNSEQSSLYGWIYLLIFIVAMICLTLITKYNPAQMLYLALILMFADSSAYFVGKRFGKHKLSKISPKKTVEGAIGGYVGGLVFSYLTIKLLILILPNNIPYLRIDTLENYAFTETFFFGLIVVLIIVILAIFGDLYESSVKRKYGVKDSGKIVYGHGGILDRLDSWVLAGIFLYIYLFFFDMGA